MIVVVGCLLLVALLGDIFKDKMEIGAAAHHIIFKKLAINIKRDTTNRIRALKH